MDWITDNKLPIGEWSVVALRWIAQIGNDSGIENALRTVAWGMFNFTNHSLSTPDPWLLAVAVPIAYWTLARRVAFSVFLGASLLLILNTGHWLPTMNTVAFVMCSVLTSTLLGLPLGLALSLFSRSENFFRPILAAAPFALAMLIQVPVLYIFGTGNGAALIASTLIGMCPIVRATARSALVSRRISGEDKSRHDTRRTSSSLFHWLRLEPSCILPSIKLAALLSLMMSTFTAIIGSQGLGSIGLQTIVHHIIDQELGMEVFVVTLLLAINIQMAFDGRRVSAATKGQSPTQSSGSGAS